MPSTSVVVVVLLVLLLSVCTTGQQFVPSSCRDTCRNAYIQDVSTSADDFLNIDPAVTTNNTTRSPFTTTRVSTWAVALLKTLRMAVPPPVNQTVTLTPPAVARLLGVYSLAVYQSYAVWSENVYAYGRYFAPIASDMVNLADPSRAAIWDALTLPSEDIFAGNFAPTEREAAAAQQAAISGAASTFIELFFCNSTIPTPYWCNGANNVLGARAILATTMAAVGQSDRTKHPAAFQQGADIATEVFLQFRMTDLLRDNNSTLPADIASIKPSQPTPAVHSCSNLTKGWWSWQQLTVPRSRAAFTPNTSSPVFPPPNYASGAAGTQIFRGFAAQIFGPAFKSTSASREMLLAGLTGPPGQSDIPGLQAAMLEVLDESATLNDAKKVIAEFWADGPESTTPPGYRTPRGYSSIEPRTINSTTHPWHVANVTDRPNRGPRTPGFSPARDIIMCWQTYEEAAQQAAASRMYGGIHIRIDNEDGLKLGTRIGENVAAFLARMSPANFLVKAPVSFRPPPLGPRGPPGQSWSQGELLCPPGTFVRIVDGRADSAGLYYLALTCSDGTFLGGQGSAGMDGTPFVISTVSDGFTSLTGGNPGGSVVSVSLTRTDGTQSQTYGMLTEDAAIATTSCRENERIVGLCFRTYSDDMLPGLGPIGLMCDDCPVDTTYRTDQVPSLSQQPTMAETDWLYDHQCPEGTYITRFFGKEGTYLSTFTGQCARSWNLRDVGMPRYAPDTDVPFSQTSLSGFRGIVVKSFTGGVDCIQFISATGALSPIYGTANFPGQAITLSCDGTRDRIVGLHGYANAYVTSVGIICSSGQFAALTTSANVLRRNRNPRQEPCIPGGYVITASLDANGRVRVRPPVRINTEVMDTGRRVSTKAAPVNTAHHSNATGLPPQQQAGLVSGASVVQETGPSERLTHVEEGEAQKASAVIADEPAVPGQG